VVVDNIIPLVPLCFLQSSLMNPPDRSSMMSVLRVLLGSSSVVITWAVMGEVLGRPSARILHPKSPPREVG